MPTCEPVGVLALPSARRARATRLLIAAITVVVLAAATVAQLTIDRTPTDLLDLSAAPYDPAVFPDRNVADAVASARGDEAATDRVMERLSPIAAASITRSAFEDAARAIDDDGLAVEGVIERSPATVMVLVRSDLGRLVVSVAPSATDPTQIDGVFVSPVPQFGSGRIADVEFVLLLVTVMFLVGIALVRPTGGAWYAAAGLAASTAFAELTPWELTQNLALFAVPVALVLALVAVADGHVPIPVLVMASAGAVASLLPVLAIDPGAVAEPYAHLIAVRSLQGHVDALQRTGAGIAIVTSLGVLAWLTAGPARAARHGRHGRRGLAWRVGGGQLGCLTLAGVGVAGLVSPPALDLTASGWSVAALSAAGAGRAGQLVRRHVDLTDVNARVADLGAAGQADLGTVIGRSLDDPTARVLHARSGGFVDAAGQAATLPDDARRFTLLVVDGETVGALVHDPAVAADPDRLRATCDAVKLSLANERLAAEIRWQLDEVRASRQRFVQAEERARARLERDLHDGAQQRLTAAMLQLRVLQRSAGEGGAELAARIEPIADEVRRAIDEIRELARGMRPSALDGGLGAAADDLAERAPLPVTITDALDVRPAPEIETVAWFVINEAVTNASRHAGAGHVDIELASDEHRLRVTITDDGLGIGPAFTVEPGQRPQVPVGTGLVGLFDRIDAHGGTLAIRRGAGSGTTVEVMLPCAP